MAFKKKEYQLKPGEVITLDQMEIGVKYIAATPLRESKWRVISDCCKARISTDVEREVLSVAGDSVPIPEEERVDVTRCSKCKQPCQKQWTTISRLIPSLSRTDDQKWHKMDQF